MATEQKIAERNTVGLVLMGSEEADVTVAMLREEQPNLRISKTNCYWMVEGENKIEVDVSAVGERLGRDLDMPTFLVVMTSYYGRVQVTDNMFGVYSEMLQMEESSQ
jgi:alkene monooxygenase coupling protein